MGRCPYEKLEDLEDVLQKVRSLETIKETKPGIFYLKNQGFLHFHIDKENHRWADIRDGKNWGAPVELPLPSTKKQKKEFIETVQSRYFKTLGK